MLYVHSINNTDLLPTDQGASGDLRRAGAALPPSGALPVRMPASTGSATLRPAR